MESRQRASRRSGAGSERREGADGKVCWDREVVAVGANQGGRNDGQTRLMVVGVAQQGVAAEAVSAVVIGSGMPLTAPLNAGVRWPDDLTRMDEWFNIMGAGCELSPGAMQDLCDAGFVVIPGPVPPNELPQLSRAYDLAVAGADAGDVSVGSTTTRIQDFVNRGPEFDGLYLHRPALDACCHVIGQPFKLSTLLARTLRPQTQAQGLHVDFEGDAEGWPMVGFILMVDEFRRDNGATCFVPGSHRWSAMPDDLLKDRIADEGRPVQACGRAGSMIIYNGSVWHGHSANQTDEPRRSIQGAYIRREVQAGFDLTARMRWETLARISPVAKYLLAI